MRLPRLRFGFHRTVAEQRAHAAGRQAVDGRVGMVGGGIVMTPVENRGGAGIDLGQPAGQFRIIEIVGAEPRRRAGVQVIVVIRPAEIRPDPPDHRLPQMVMGIHQPRHCDHPSAVDHFGILDRQLGPDGGDQVVLYQDIAARKVADLGIDRDDRRSSNQIG